MTRHPRILDVRTEPAERTPAHDRFRADAPAGLILYDLWTISEVLTEDADGQPLGISTVRLARVSTTPPKQTPGEGLPTMGGHNGRG